MRVALLSDIHGNAVALDAVLKDLASQGPFDEVVVAGDLAWSGPRPAEVVDRIRALNATVVQGNTDAFFALPTGPAPDGKNSDRFAAQRAWMETQLGKERTSFLATLPFSHRIAPEGGGDLLVVHANPRDLEEPITHSMPESELDRLLFVSTVERPWGVLAFGHVHTPFQRRWRDRLLVNVASAGLPMDGDPRAAWAILAWERGEWRVAHRRVFYNAQVVARDMRVCGMPRGKHFAERLMSASYRSSEPALASAVME